MPDTRQFAPADAASSAAFTQYLMRSALDTAQFTQRHQQLVSAVARRQVTPNQVERAFAVAADWSAIATEVSAAISTFAHALSQLALLPHQCTADPSDTIVANAHQVAVRHDSQVEELTTLLVSLAQPDVTAGARRRALTRLTVSSANHTLGTTATAWFGMLESVSSASLRMLNPSLLAVLRATQPIGYDGEVIEIKGLIATNATTQLEIENTLERPASLRCSCQEIRRADGIGPAFTPAITVTPTHQLLDARAEGNIAISLWLDSAQFDAQTTYVGALSVESDGGTTLKIPLRVTTVLASS